MIPQYLVDFDLSALPMVETDVLVIGSGIAGLFTAIKASEQRSVLMITKKSLLESNTRYAQGESLRLSLRMIHLPTICRIHLLQERDYAAPKQ